MILPRLLRSQAAAREGLRKEERRFEIHAHHRVPVFLREVDREGAADGAGVVDQDVGTAELRVHGVDAFGQRRDLVERAFDPVQSPTGSLHLRRGLVRRAAPERRDVGAGLRECNGDRLPQPRVGAGDDRDAILQRPRVHQRSWQMSSTCMSV